MHYLKKTSRSVVPSLKHEALPLVMCRCRVIVIGHSTLLKVTSAESHVWTASAGSLLGHS